MIHAWYWDVFPYPIPTAVRFPTNIVCETNMSARHVQCHPHRSLVRREVVLPFQVANFYHQKKNTKPNNLHIFGIFWNLGTFKKGMKNKISTLPISKMVQGSTWRDLVDRSIPTPTSSWNVTWVESLSHFLPTNFQWFFHHLKGPSAIARGKNKGKQSWPKVDHLNLR